ncbi:hypothetical protein ATANTOWER_019320, partial [Ataeniobius toweri]|nr:hypothetical protein [Ataeniobius toweri]
TKRTLSTLRRTYLRARHRYSSLRSSGIQLQAGTEYIHPAPLCLSLMQSSIHPTMGANQFQLSYHFIKINSLTFSLSPECSLHVGQILKQKDDNNQ